MKILKIQKSCEFVLAFITIRQKRTFWVLKGVLMDKNKLSSQWNAKVCLFSCPVFTMGRSWQEGSACACKRKKNLQDMHGRYLLCKSHWVPGLKSCWNSQCARWKKVVLLDDVDAQFSPRKFKFLPTKKNWICILSILSTKNSIFFKTFF